MLFVVGVWFLSAGCQKTAEEWTRVGEMRLRALRLEEAQTAFQRAMDQDPGYAPALYGMGWVHHIRQDSRLARVFFSRCMEADPEYYGCYKGMGSLHLAMGYYPQAEASFKRAIKLKPDEAATWSSLGYVYFLSRRLDKAEEAYRKALELEPDRAEVHYLIAELRARQEAYDVAMEQLDLAENKPFREVRFRMLSHQLRGKLLLRLALKGVRPGERATLSTSELDSRLEMLEKAESEVNTALELTFVEERIGLNRLLRKIRQARERLEGPPPI